MILDRMQYLEVAEVPAEVVAQAEEDVRVSTLLQRQGDVSTYGSVVSHPAPLPFQAHAAGVYIDRPLLRQDPATGQISPVLPQFGDADVRVATWTG